MLSFSTFSGDDVTVSGIYRSVHYAHRWDDAEHVFIKGQTFPKCRFCQDCEFVLVKAAPSAAEVPEFREAEKKAGSELPAASKGEANPALPRALDKPFPQSA